MSEPIPVVIEMDSAESEALMRQLPPDVQAQYRAEALKRRVPVGRVMQEALVAVAADFRRVPEAA